MAFTFKKRSNLPGFGLALGYTVLYLSLIVLIPLVATFLKASSLSWEQFWHIAASPRAVASYRLTFGASLIGALVNLVFGVLVAWVLVRYSFPGKRLFDSLVDLPFALPTAVAGIALTTIYAPSGWLGRPLASIGIQSAYSPLGVAIRASMDCPHWPITTKSSTTPVLSGPKMSSQGWGRGTSPARNLLARSCHESCAAGFSAGSGSRSSVSKASSAMLIPAIAGGSLHGMLFPVGVAAHGHCKKDCPEGNKIPADAL